MTKQIFWGYIHVVLVKVKVAWMQTTHISTETFAALLNIREAGLMCPSNDRAMEAVIGIVLIWGGFEIDRFVYR